MGLEAGVTLWLQMGDEGVRRMPELSHPPGFPIIRTDSFALFLTISAQSKTISRLPHSYPSTWQEVEEGAHSTAISCAAIRVVTQEPGGQGGSPPCGWPSPEGTLVITPQRSFLSYFTRFRGRPGRVNAQLNAFKGNEV